MEAVAAAASIAGIIAVVGQSIDGLVKFSDFFSDISSASKTISRLLNDINSLIQVLEDIGDVLERARARRNYQNFASLDIKLEDCAKDVQIWLATARLLRPASDSGGKAWLRKFRLAVNNTAIRTIREEIARHKQTLCLSIEVFGRYMIFLLSRLRNMSLSIDSGLRTIDIDTSNQVHQIGGRFDEALSTSLSVHGAHEEALRRIEHYSLTSMHSSAHSIRSMDSIRTELSRLEAMITTASVTQPSETEVGINHTGPGPSRTERQYGTVTDEISQYPYLSDSGPLPGHGRESATAKNSGIDLALQHDSTNGTQESLDRNSQAQRTEDMAGEHYIQPDSHEPSTNHRSSLEKSEDVNKRLMENPSEGENKSSVLYAEYSKHHRSRQHQSPRTDIDCDALHPILRQSLATIYPPEVVRYVSLRQVTALCEGHIDLLDKQPNVQMLAFGKTKERSYVDSSTLASARPSMIKLRDHLIELQNAIKVSREQCIQAGYSLSELDKLLSLPGSGSSAPAN